MKIVKELLPGAFLLQPNMFDDERGRFVKTFHLGLFESLGLPTDWKEEYYSVNRKGVIRGMHFQKPPMQHSKMVYCLRGRVLDVILDIRTDSPAYGRHACLEISADTSEVLVIPPGIAHGFCALTDEAILQYKVSSVYSAEHDAGVLWNSFGFNWPMETPILSKRDRCFPALADFESRFVSGPARLSGESL